MKKPDTALLILLGVGLLGVTPQIAHGGAAPLDGQVEKAALERLTLCGMGRSKKCDIEDAITLGMFETGLRPQFPKGLKCRDIDEQWAISYTAKRNRVNYHGGIDMPAPNGTPMIATADGTVVGKYRGNMTPRGIEVVLRHSPAQTGLPMWTYTQYAHFSRMPKLEIGQQVKMGDKLGPTGNSGISTKTGKQSLKRRPAIHFAVFYAPTKQYADTGKAVIPLKGKWMDPNALYRKKGPFDSSALKALPAKEKKIAIPVMLENGKFIPADTKVIWPYACEGK